MDQESLNDLLDQLASLPDETEWVEFKTNNGDQKAIGEYCSALSNSTRLADQQAGYLVFGVEDGTHNLVGTDLTLNDLKVGNEEFQNWLTNRLRPSINVEFYEFDRDDKHFIILIIHPAIGSPVQFNNAAYIRVGSAKRPLNSLPEKERLLWQKCSDVNFENGVASSGNTREDVLNLLDAEAYFELQQTIPDSNPGGIIERFLSERFITQEISGNYAITNLGAVLLAKDFDAFPSLRRCGIRIITYDGRSRINALKEREGKRGYASGFANIIAYIQSQLPEWEEIEGAVRTTKTTYPEIAIREFVANALIHQDFHISGSGPMVEIFEDRIEISNPGVPLVDKLRLMDNNPISRNETLAAFMRRAGLCEERGSGIDRAVFFLEASQLPAPNFDITETHMKVTIYGPKTFAEMTRRERVDACYWHCCLMHVSGETMNNQTLRDRLGVSQRNYPMASQVIADAKEEGLIKDFDPDNRAPRYAKYIPFWA